MSVPQTSREALIHNEQVKLYAHLLNGMALFAYASATVLYAGEWMFPGQLPERWDDVKMAFFVGALAAQVLARRHLRKLRVE